MRPADRIRRHVEEACVLWSLRRARLHDPAWTATAQATFDRRLRAHLRAAQRAGEPAWAIALQQLRLPGGPAVATFLARSARTAPRLGVLAALGLPDPPLSDVAPWLDAHPTAPAPDPARGAAFLRDPVAALQGDDAETAFRDLAAALARLDEARLPTLLAAHIPPDPLAAVAAHVAFVEATAWGGSYGWLVGAAARAGLHGAAERALISVFGVKARPLRIGVRAAPALRAVLRDRWWHALLEHGARDQARLLGGRRWDAEVEEVTLAEGPLAARWLAAIGRFVRCGTWRAPTDPWTHPCEEIAP